MRGLLAIALVGCSLSPSAAAVATDLSFFANLRAADLQLATLGDRFARANAGLCDRLQPATGLVVQALDGFAPDVRPAAQRAFGFATPIAIEAVIVGSGGAQADIRPNDSIVSIDGHAIDAAPLAAKASVVRLTSFLAGLADRPPARPITFGLIRDGAPIARRVTPTPECRARFELLVSASDDSDASDDGVTVQVSSHLFGRLSAEESAVVVAHELAHVILHHEARLDAAGVHGGLVGGLGRNVRYFRQTETEADILSVDLLANAGFAPESAAAFWRGPGRKLSAFTDRSHPSAADRAATTEREAAAIRADPARAQHPPILAGRDQPLTGDWQSILVRAR